MGERASREANIQWDRRAPHPGGSAPPFLVPALLLAGATILFRFTAIDLDLSGPFYLGGGTINDWPLVHREPWLSIYRYGPWPALVLGFGGLAVGLASYGCPRLHGCRRTGFFLAALLALGPGLAVNGYKGHCGRPRPVQVVQFGGDREFLPVLDWSPDDRAKSFPSGHASMGFYLMAPGFVLYRRNKRLALLFFALGLGAGSLIGLGRVVQGRHFASDILWSAGVIYLFGAILERVFRLLEPRAEQEREAQWTRGEKQVLSVEAARRSRQSSPLSAQPARSRAA